MPHPDHHDLIDEEADDDRWGAHQHVVHETYDLGQFAAAPVLAVLLFVGLIAALYGWLLQQARKPVA